MPEPSVKVLNLHRHNQRFRFGIIRSLRKRQTHTSVGLEHLQENQISVAHVFNVMAASLRDVINVTNNDERAPVFEAANYGIVGGLYEVLPLLTAALKK